MSVGPCGSLDKASRFSIYEHQAPATLNQAAPVQNTYYPILNAVDNCRAYLCSVSVATTGEDLECRITIDGNASTPLSVAAGAGTTYYLYSYGQPVGGLWRTGLSAAGADQYHKAFLCEGRLVDIDLRKTSANGAGNLTAVATYGVLSTA